MIIETEVWCIGESPENVELGLPEGDQWMPFIFDIRNVSAIKLAGPTEFLGDDKATIHIFDKSFTINKTYFDMADLFKQSRQ